MSKIPKQVRDNFENTSILLHQAQAMLRAVEHMAEAAEPPASPEAESLYALITATQGKLTEADKAHAAEWAGHGGNTDLLTPEEIAAARGEAEPMKIGVDGWPTDKADYNICL